MLVDIQSGERVCTSRTPNSPMTLLNGSAIYWNSDTLYATDPSVCNCFWIQKKKLHYSKVLSDISSSLLVANFLIIKKN